MTSTEKMLHECCLASGSRPPAPGAGQNSTAPQAPSTCRLEDKGKGHRWKDSRGLEPRRTRHCWGLLRPRAGQGAAKPPSKAGAAGGWIKAQGLLLSPELGHFNSELK